MEMKWEIRRFFKGKEICAEFNKTGNGISVLLCGGDLPHIGAVAVIGPKTPLQLTVFPGHKEGEIAGRWAKKLWENYQLPIVVSVGIHYNQITKDEIAGVLLLTEEMLACAWKGVTMNKELVIEKTKELIEGGCCPELKEAASAYLTAVGQADEEKQQEAYLAELKEDIIPIDGLIAFMGSEEAKEHIGAEICAGILENAKKRKAAGELYCDCPACSKALEVVAAFEA